MFSTVDSIVPLAKISTSTCNVAVGALRILFTNASADEIVWDAGVFAGYQPGELSVGSERHDEKYDAWTAGIGVEKTLGSIAIRGEFRYADHGSSKRTVRFDEVAVTVPVELATSEIGVGFGLIWRP